MARLQVAAAHSTAAIDDLLRLWWTEPDTVWGQAALWQLADSAALDFSASERRLIRTHLPAPPAGPMSDATPLSLRPAPLHVLWHAAPAGGPLEAQLQHAQGVLQLRLQHPEASLRWLQPLILSTPPGAFLTTVHFSLGQAHSAAGHEEQALEQLQAARDGEGPLVTEALAQAGELATRLHRYAEARRDLEALLLANPVGQARARALWGLGWVAFRAGEASRARSFFSALRREDPYGPAASAAAYWEGRALQNLGDGAAARARWTALRQASPTDYYAYRAEQLLGPAPWPTAHAEPAPVEPAAVQQIDALLTAGMQRRARLALQSALARTPHWDPHTLQNLAQAAQRAESPSLAAAFEAARCSRFGGDDPHCLAALSGGLRTRHWGTLQEAAHANRLDPALVLSVARVESSFVAEARSAAGALGLMQLMPATAKSLWHEERQRPPHRGELLNPAVNVRLGTRYLARLLRSFDHCEEYALATYNAGGAAVTRWRALQGELPADVFVEEIPFSQPANTSKKCLAGGSWRACLRLAESAPIR